MSGKAAFAGNDKSLREGLLKERRKYYVHAAWWFVCFLSLAIFGAFVYVVWHVLTVSARTRARARSRRARVATRARVTDARWT